jgi:hypothetical protein
MQSSTARYRFEFRLLEWAEKQGRVLCGARRSMFVGVRPDGAVRRVYFAPQGESFEGNRKTTLAESHAHWFLYLPHAEPGSGYLEWFNLERAVAERWLELRLEAGDFLDVRAPGSREEWPVTWRVLLR